MIEQEVNTRTSAADYISACKFISSLHYSASCGDMIDM